MPSWCAGVRRPMNHTEAGNLSAGCHPCGCMLLAQACRAAAHHKAHCRDADGAGGVPQAAAERGHPADCRWVHPHQGRPAKDRPCGRHPGQACPPSVRLVDTPWPAGWRLPVNTEECSFAEAHNIRNPVCGYYCACMRPGDTAQLGHAGKGLTGVLLLHRFDHADLLDDIVDHWCASQCVCRLQFCACGSTSVALQSGSPKDPLWYVDPLAAKSRAGCHFQGSIWAAMGCSGQVLLACAGTPRPTCTSGVTLWSGCRQPPIILRSFPWDISL